MKHFKEFYPQVNVIDYTKAKADSPATVQDAIGAIMYGITRRGTAPFDMGKMNVMYPDCKDVNDGYENMYIFMGVLRLSVGFL